MALLQNHGLVCGAAVAAIWLLTEGGVDVRELKQAAQPRADQPARFHHVHINAVDPDASIEYYRTWFKSERATFAGVNALRTPNGWLLFNKTRDAAPNGTASGFWHIGWGSSDTKSLYDRMVAKGAPFAIPLTEIKSAAQATQRYFFYAAGPDQESIEIFAESGGDEFEHVHLRAVDMVATEQWYVTHLGAHSAPAGEPPGPKGVPPPVWLDRVAFRFGRLAGRTTYESSRGRVLDHFAFSVDNLDRALARLQQDGVKVVEAPHAIFGGALTSAFIEAPDRVQVELVEDHNR